MNDGVFTIGLHSHEMHDGPVLTYFDPKMIEKVKILKERGIEFESYDSTNIEDESVAMSPDGQMFYFFPGEI